MMLKKKDFFTLPASGTQIRREEIDSILYTAFNAGGISGWKQVQEEKRKAIAEKKRKREESKAKEESKHDKFLEICRKADAEGLSYAKYVLKYGL